MDDFRPSWAREAPDDELAARQDEDAWDVIHSFFDSRGLVRHQLDSFDDFVTNGLQEVVTESLPVCYIRDVSIPGSDIELLVSFGPVHMFDLTTGHSGATPSVSARST